MRQMAQTARDKREAMGKAACAKIQREFDKKLVVEKTVRAILD